MTKINIDIHSIRTSPPQNMNCVEAAHYIGVSERKLRDSISNGDIKVIRFGSRLILRKSDLDNFLESLAA